LYSFYFLQDNQEENIRSRRFHTEETVLVALRPPLPFSCHELTISEDLLMDCSYF